MGVGRRGAPGARGPGFGGCGRSAERRRGWARVSAGGVWARVGRRLLVRLEAGAHLRLERRASGEAALPGAGLTDESSEKAASRQLLTRRRGRSQQEPLYRFSLPPAPLPLARSTHFQNVDGFE